MCSRESGNNPPKGLGIYIHIPFCVRKCPYCGFNSTATDNIPESAYIEAVLKELALLIEEEALHNRTVETIYLGGGTPSLLLPHSVDTLLNTIARSLTVASIPEVSMEINPGTVDKERLKGFRKAGINRIVIGIQSMSPVGLNALGRVHTVEDSLTTFHNSIEAGFTNIGVDLIYAIPGQTHADWLKELFRVVSLGPQHISTYELTVEEGTPFERLERDGTLNMPEDEAIVRMYLEGSALLKESGYLHYEISNFAIEGYQCRHNLKYWHSEDYVGIGVAAHSWLRGWGCGVRWHNTENITAYMESLKVGRLPRANRVELSAAETLTERLLMGMRLSEGISLGRIKAEFGISLRESSSWKHLVAEGLLEEDGDRVRLTQRGMLLSNEILALLMRS